MRTIGIKGAGVVPIVLWGKPHQFGKFDGGGAGGGGGDQGPLFFITSTVPRIVMGLFTTARDVVRGALGL